jgi:hypothetical protein
MALDPDSKNTAAIINTLFIVVYSLGMPLACRAGLMDAS